MKLPWKEWKQKTDFPVTLYETSANNKILLRKIALIVGLFISSMCFTCDFVYNIMQNRHALSHELFQKINNNVIFFFIPKRK